jgi:hypothetical protein
MEYDETKGIVRFSPDEQQAYDLPVEVSLETDEFGFAGDKVRTASVEMIMNAYVALEDESFSREDQNRLRHQATKAVELWFAMREAQVTNEVTRLERDFNA